MSVFDGYKASLKPLDVEEPIDVYLHRPLGYLVALASFRTPVSPNHITLLSMIFGVVAGVCILLPFSHHLLVAGALVLLSTVLDCADGQLARMRKSASTVGRMLDGVADSVVSVAVVGPWLYSLWTRYESDPWMGCAMVGLAVGAIMTSSFHTAMYDHYKNVYLLMTRDGSRDAESDVAARERYEKQRATEPWWKRIAWRIYLVYTGSQADVVRGFDPFTSVRVDAFPSYDPERAAIYKEHNQKLMRVWKSMFGFGSLMFGIALFVALGLPEVFVALRLLLLNGIFYLYLRPAQRRASRCSFEQIGLRMPDKTCGGEAA